jgi:hypothetical protein
VQVGDWQAGRRDLASQLRLGRCAVAAGAQWHGREIVSGRSMLRASLGLVRFWNRELMHRRRGAAVVTQIPMDTRDHPGLAIFSSFTPVGRFFARSNSWSVGTKESKHGSKHSR